MDSSSRVRCQAANELIEDAIDVLGTFEMYRMALKVEEGGGLDQLIRLSRIAVREMRRAQRYIREATEVRHGG